MQAADKLELHYYFGDDSHNIDALVRNKCESELLGIITEVANLLEIDAALIKEAYREGGFRDIWKALGSNSAQLTLLLLIVQIVISTIPLLGSESKDLEIEERKLSIQEKKLNIENLKQEAEKGNPNLAVEKVTSSISKNLRIIKRKSNLFAQLEEYFKVEKIGLAVLDETCNPINNEKSVPRSEFKKYILETNRLRSQEDDGAVIEIISPVLKEGRYKWKGVYNGEAISFEMQDTAFRDSVLLDNIPFQHGSKIVCILITHRELDEIGDVKITGYSVSTVLEKIDADTSQETAQGKKHRHAKRLVESQGTLFAKNSDK